MRRSRSQHKQLGAPQVTPFEREYKGSRRDPEGRTATTRKEIREKMLDKTLADSFPTSDPPSSIPDPCAADSMGADVKDVVLIGGDAPREPERYASSRTFLR